MSGAAQVILVRHAHAEWPEYHGRDFDRPLTPRGEADAAAMARAIQATGVKPARVIASPALRTRQTAAIVARQLAVADAAIEFIDCLYNASAESLHEELRKASEGAGPTLLVAHNPGISELARRLARDPAYAPFSPADWRLLEVDSL